MKIQLYQSCYLWMLVMICLMHTFKITALDNIHRVVWASMGEFCVVFNAIIFETFFYNFYGGVTDFFSSFLYLLNWPCLEEMK